MSNEEINLDRDWNVNVNLSGLNAPTGKASNVELPEGYYKAKITDMYVNPDRNPNRVVIKMTVCEGPFSGLVRTDGMTKPKSDEDKVRYYWRGLAESAGYTPAQLDKGRIELGRATFIDKEVHIRFTPKQGEGTYENIDYLAPSEWNQQRQIFDASRRAEGTDAPSGSALGGDSSGDTTTKGDVLSQLGIGA